MESKEIKTAVDVEEGPAWVDPDDDRLLAAALAATLVAYRRRIEQDTGGSRPHGAGQDAAAGADTWQLLARWEQLRGAA